MNAVGGALIQDHDQARSLDEAGQGDGVVVGKRIGQAMRAGSILAQVTDALLVDGLGPRLDVTGLQVAGDIAVIRAHTRSSPDSRQVRLSVRHPRRRRNEIRLAVRSAWGSGR